MSSVTASSYISSTMGKFIILIFLTTLADKFSVGATGIDVHIVFDHQATFEVHDDTESEWNRAKRSLDYQVRRSRKLTWSADALAGNNMDEDMDKGKIYKEKGKKDEEKDYEVIDLTNRGKAGLLNEPWVRKIRTMALLPVLGVGILLVILFYYQVCLKKKACTCLCDICPCCNSLNPKMVGRKKVNKYMPGVIINEEENTVEYYEMTDREREAMHDVAGALA